MINKNGAAVGGMRAVLDARLRDSLSVYGSGWAEYNRSLSYGAEAGLRFRW